VEQDGSMNFLDGSSRGGRTFHGLGTQLTGYKVIIFIEVLDHFVSYSSLETIKMPQLQVTDQFSRHENAS